MASKEHFSLRQIVIDIACEDLRLSKKDCSDTTIKKYLENFSNVFEALDVDLKNLQNERHRYSFDAAEKNFIEEILRNYTTEPVLSIRKGMYQNIPYDFAVKMEQFILTHMRTLGKSDDVINEQMMKFHHKTRWKYLNSQSVFFATNAIEELFYEIVDEFSLGIDDKLFLLEHVSGHLQPVINLIIETWRETKDEMKDLRQEEISDIGIEQSDVPNYLIYSDQQCSIEEALNCDSHLNALRAKSKALAENHRLKDHRELTEIQKEIEKRERQLTTEIKQKFCIDTDTMSQINSVQKKRLSSQALYDSLQKRILLEMSERNKAREHRVSKKEASKARKYLEECGYDCDLPST